MANFRLDIFNVFRRILGLFTAILVMTGVIIIPGEKVVEQNFMKGDEVFLSEAAEGAYWTLGFSKKIITPSDVLTNSKKYYLAGYGNNTHPTEVMDDLYVRTIYLDDNSGRGGVVLAVIDAIGLNNKEVLEIREMLKEFTAQNNIKSVNVLSTHDHAGIDTQGLWGNTYMLKTGRNEEHNTFVKKKIAESIKEAYANAAEGKLYWGDILPEPNIINDNREPYVYDETLTRLRFVAENTLSEVYICTLNAHPEMMAQGNSTVSADYPAYMGKYIEERTGGEFIFINGAIGALINGKGLSEVFHITGDALDLVNLDENNKNEVQRTADDIAALYGETGNATVALLNSITTADLDSKNNLNAEKKSVIRKSFTKSFGETVGRYMLAIDNEKEIAPYINIRHEAIEVPIDNYILALAAKIGLIKLNHYPAGKDGLDSFSTTEVGYLELGSSLRIMLAPGELAPEVAMGGALSTEDSAMGYEYDKKTAFEIIDPDNTAADGQSKNLVFGLCNDEIGYIIPDNDFYVHRFLPYIAQESDRNGNSHYEETVSAGPKTAGIVIDALQSILNSLN